MTNTSLKRILLTVSAFSLLGASFIASSNRYSVDPSNPTYKAFEQKLADDIKEGLIQADETFVTRWNQEVSDLEKAQAPIPYEKLHDYALELLRSRTVAKDDVADGEKDEQ
jgi:hypothetical protein